MSIDLTAEKLYENLKRQSTSLKVGLAGRGPEVKEVISPYGIITYKWTINPNDSVLNVDTSDGNLIEAKVNYDLS